jgi:hypothetical protein
MALVEKPPVNIDFGKIISASREAWEATQKAERIKQKPDLARLVNKLLRLLDIIKREYLSLKILASPADRTTIEGHLLQVSNYTTQLIQNAKTYAESTGNEEINYTKCIDDAKKEKKILNGLRTTFMDVVRKHKKNDKEITKTTNQTKIDKLNTKNEELIQKVVDAVEEAESKSIQAIYEEDSLEDFIITIEQDVDTLKK